MKQILFAFILLLLFLGFSAVADEPKPDEAKKKAVDEALKAFTGT